LLAYAAQLRGSDQPPTVPGWRRGPGADAAGRADARAGDRRGRPRRRHDRGDITYYAPWGNLALFYRDFPYSNGLIRLGTLDTGAADVLADLTPDTPANITLGEPNN
jgi:hypothetical protein